MTFLISHVTIAAPWLIAVGFVIGILGGFFGVGGSFLAGPALYVLGLPMNYVVGTDIAHIVGKSVVAAKKHRALGNVDVKLGLVMALGTIPGVEIGARVVQALKRTQHADLALGLSFSAVLLVISTFIVWESIGAIRRTRASKTGKIRTTKDPKRDRLHFNTAWQWIHGIRLRPMVRLPVSGIRVSFWAVLGVALVGGFFSGFLGGGAGYIRMPMLVYVLGVPTHVAIGTDLFEIILSAGYGTFSHALKGNVDILIALVMHTGAAIGAQIGAQATEKFHGPGIRLAFAPLPILGAATLLYELHHRGLL
ncbi:MAG TPA: sulfite exporter TauE/SafE family protein [Thermoanaerobaculia bacterium]|nr:sulfite exporter TauE/SafE family protein [Thermoanaerobaculia bacterium]